MDINGLFSAVLQRKKVTVLQEHVCEFINSVCGKEHFQRERDSMRGQVMA